MNYYYVTLNEHYISRQKRWTVRMGVSQDEPTGHDNLLAAYSVRASSASEATAIVANELRKGRLEMAQEITPSRHSVRA